MKKPKVTNGSKDKFGLTPGMSGPKNSSYTQGAADNWYNEVVHVSKDKITKINNFLDQYDPNGREVDPEVRC